MNLNVIQVFLTLEMVGVKIEVVGAAPVIVVLLLNMKQANGFFVENLDLRTIMIPRPLLWRLPTTKDKPV
jgi:hypothetical protein